MNLDQILKHSPFNKIKLLIEQFHFLGEQGTRIMIYNMREDELNFEFDNDIRINNTYVKGTKNANYSQEVSLYMGVSVTSNREITLPRQQIYQVIIH